MRGSGRRSGVLLGVLVVGLFAVGCAEDPRGGDGPFARDSGAAVRDGGSGDAHRDAGGGGDAGDGADGGGRTDAGGPVDAGAIRDAGGGGRTDAGGPDAGAIRDAGGGAGFDAGSSRDGGARADAGPADSGVPDASVVRDAGTSRDGGPPSGAGDLWIEISYVNANTPRSPAFLYSVSPGWTATSWGFTGSRTGGAEAWDRFDNMQVVSDPIGTSLAIGGSSQLQLMLGLVPLISYTGATVELEGRSRATSSRVFFDVTNPLNGCGGSGEMDQDWTPDIVQIDLTGCYNPGGAVQAVRVDPTSGTIALRRMRLTLHGAQW